MVEYLPPLTIEPPTDQWTRTVHADRDGCWITSRNEVFRCDRGEDGTRRRIDLDPSRRGTVRWIQPDPYAEPANADIMAGITFPPPHDSKSDEVSGP